MSNSQDNRPQARLTVIAQDPSVRVNGRILTSRVEVPAEKLEPGPTGYRVQVLDYDATRDRFLKPAAITGDDKFEGVDPDELVGNPAFHAQNVYAIAMSTLARFERALGRRVQWGFRDLSHQLKVVPHAFADANAYYSREQEALLWFLAVSCGNGGIRITCGHGYQPALLDWPGA